MIKGIETATSEFTGLGIMAIPAIVVYAAFNTAFPEELLFRGFLLKRLTHLSTGVVSQLEITSDRSPSSYKKNEGC